MFQPPQPLITAAPPLVQARVAGGEVIGYFVDGSTWTYATCMYPGGLTISDSFFTCAVTTETSDVPFPTTCVDGSVLVFPTGGATTSLNCNGPCCAAALLSDDKDDTPVMGYSCIRVDCHSTLYMSTFSVSSTTGTQTTKNPDTSTNPPNSSLFSEFSTSSSTTPKTAPQNNGDSTSISPGTGSTSTPGSQSPGAPTHHSSRTWIAGAVVAPLVAVAIILGLAFWIWKLKRSQKATPPAVGDGPSGKSELPSTYAIGIQSTGMHDAGIQGAGVQTFETRGHERAELSHGHRVLEAPNTGFTSELPAYSSGYGGR